MANSNDPRESGWYQRTVFIGQRVKASASLARFIAL